jgi:hypothetical protein
MAITAILGIMDLMYWELSAIPYDAPVFLPLAQNFETIIRVMGVAIAAVGAAILAMTGDMMIGGIVTGVGLATIAASFIPTDGGSMTPIVLQAIAPLIANAGGMLATESGRNGSLD